MLPLRRPRAALITAATVALGAVVTSLTLGGCGALGGGVVSTIGEVDFENPLRIPPLAEAGTEGHSPVALTAQEGESTFLPGRETPSWGFNGAYLGPTIVAERGAQLSVNVRNDSPEATTVHWHGMHLPAEADGGPHQLVQPGESWSPSWRIDQPAATLWYHPHTHGQTEKHVSRGLAGMVILRDEAEAALPLPRNYGVDDVPVIVQDARFDGDARLVTSTRGFIGPIGDRLLVNGTIGPFLEAVTDVVRLRLLNASPARIYDFALDDGREMALIASDGGLLAAPHHTDHVQLSPGERAEVLVRLAPGERVVLQSRPPTLGVEGVLEGINVGDDSFDVLELRAAGELASVGTVPEALVPLQELPEPTVERRFELEDTEINGRDMDMARVDETVSLGATEAWTVVNTSGMPHSFHVHDVQFRVASIDGAPPPPHLAGWKDTIYAPPEQEFRLVMRFEDYADPNTPYMYHCHLLWHEDVGMMGQFVVVEPGRSAAEVGGTRDEHSTHEH